MRGLVGSCHPAPTLAVTLVAVLLGAGVGLAPGRVALLGLAVLTGQLSIGWSNDRIDAARDAATGRRDKPAATGGASLPALTAAAGIALAATVVLSLLLGPPAGASALTLVAAGWGYNLGLKGTVLSALAYAVGFSALPAAAYLARPERVGPPWWVPVVGALLGVGAHFANVLPDLRDDAATGVRGLPQRLGARRGVMVMAVLVAAASVVLGLAPDGVTLAFSTAAVALGVGGAVAVTVLATLRPETPLAFRLTLVLAVVDVVLVVALAV